VNSLFLIGS